MQATHGDLRFRYPDKPVDAPFSFLSSIEKSKNWLCQDKYDGWRVQIYFKNNGIHLLTRVGRELSSATKVSPEIINHLKSMNVKSGAVLDGEYVGTRGSHACCIYLFDILALEGSWLEKVPYIDRWNLVQKALPNSIPLVHLAHTIDSGFEHRFLTLKDHWIKNGRGMDLCEGIVVKRKSGYLDLSFSDNSKSKHMFKIKYRDIRREIRA